MKNLKYLALMLLTIMLSFTACKKDEPDPDAGKAKITNLAINPQSSLKFGDVVTLTGNFTDEIGLKSYTVTMSNSTGVIFEATKMLTGTSFNLNEALTIPLPKNAVAGDMKLSVTVKNSGNLLTTEEITIAALALPTFDKLYLIINSAVFTMNKNGNVFEFEDFIPAGGVGKIYAKADKTGLSWGLDGSNIIAMGTGDITIGKTAEEFFKISFNPVSFELVLGDAQEWNSMTESLYILGNISGHWADGNISTEKEKMKMSGFSLGNRKMWSWTPPNTGSGSPDDDMWGNIVPGVFRFKKPGVEEYILFTSGQITAGTTNDDASSFVVTAGGPFTIKVFSDGTNITSVRLESDTRKLEYTNQGIYINGSLAGSVTFAGTALTLVPGNYFLYEGSMTLTKNQAITAQGIDLATAFCDRDVFTGSGNATWSMIQETGTYLVRIDPFLGNVYIRNEAGFPSAIYLDGWCWGKYDADSHNWNQTTMATLYRKGTSFVYEATIYILPWGGDVAFFAAPFPTNPDASKMEIYSKYFEGVTMAGNGLLLPVPAEAAYYKVAVDLKDGFTWDMVNMDGTNYTILPTNGKKFTVTFTAL